MIIIRFIYYLSYFCKCFSECTDVTTSEYKLLCSTQRKLTLIQTSCEQNKSVQQKQIPIQNEYYKPLIQLLNSDDFAFLDFFGEFSASESIVSQCVRCFASQGLISTFLEHEITKEVSQCTSESTLFRGKSFGTQCLSGFAHIVDYSYLSYAFKIFLNHLHSCNENFEVNSNALGLDNENHPQIKQNQIALHNECMIALSFINGTANQCSNSLKNVCYLLRTIVGKKFPNNQISSVGGLFFLRFICPCIVAPERFNLSKADEISKQTRRNSILISKILQNLSNQVAFGKKEPFMMVFNDFLDKNRGKMDKLLSSLSNQYYNEIPLTHLLKDSDLHDIHKCLYDNKDKIQEDLQKQNLFSIHEQFLQVINKLGSPIEKNTSTSSTNASSGLTPLSSIRKKAFTIIGNSNAMRRKSVAPSFVPKENFFATQFYFGLLDQLSSNSFQFIETIWNVGSLKEGETICKSSVQIFDKLSCSIDCTKVLIQREVNDCSTFKKLDLVSYNFIFNFFLFNSGSCYFIPC